MQLKKAERKLTAALRPGKLKKASGPCRWGIWFSTDNILTACFGCTGGKGEKRKSNNKTVAPSLLSIHRYLPCSLALQLVSYRTSPRHIGVIALRGQVKWQCHTDGSESFPCYHLPRGLLPLVACWRATSALGPWCCSWPALPTCPLASLWRRDNVSVSPNTQTHTDRKRRRTIIKCSCDFQLE